MNPTLDAGPAPADSTKYQRNVAAIKAAMAGKPQPEIDAEVERYLRSEGGTPVDESDPTFGFGQNFKNATPDNTVPDLAQGARGLKDAVVSLGKGAVRGGTLGIVDPGPSPVPEGDELGKFMGESALVGGAGKALGAGASALKANPLTSSIGKILAHGHGGGVAGAYYGYKEGGIPGAVAGYAGGGLLGKALAGAAGKVEGAAPAITPPQLVGSDEISQSVVSNPAFTKAMNGGFAKAGQAAGRVASGNDAMAQGISNLTPQAPNPMSMEDAFNAAGRAGAPASAGNADMAQGIANLKPGKMPLDKAMGVLSKGMPGAGKFGGGAAGAVGMALQGPQNPLQGGMAPVPPPLSTNLPEAKQAGLQALEAGQPHSALAQMLGLKYDAATVKFVLAGLPNRVPQ